MDGYHRKTATACNDFSLKAIVDCCRIKSSQQWCPRKARKPIWAVDNHPVAVV